MTSRKSTLNSKEQFQYGSYRTDMSHSTEYISSFSLSYRLCDNLSKMSMKTVLNVGGTIVCVCDSIRASVMLVAE